jgi:hypothetical protein
MLVTWEIARIWSCWGPDTSVPCVSSRSAVEKYAALLQLQYAVWTGGGAGRNLYGKYDAGTRLGELLVA